MPTFGAVLLNAHNEPINWDDEEFTTDGLWPVEVLIQDDPNVGPIITLTQRHHEVKAGEVVQSVTLQMEDVTKIAEAHARLVAGRGN